MLRSQPLPPYICPRYIAGITRTTVFDVNIAAGDDISAGAKFAEVYVRQFIRIRSKDTSLATFPIEIRAIGGKPLATPVAITLTAGDYDPGKSVADLILAANATMKYEDLPDTVALYAKPATAKAYTGVLFLDELQERD